MGNFPDGPVVKNSPCKAGNMGFIPGGRTKIPNATEQLSPCSAMEDPAWCNEDPMGLN